MESEYFYNSPVQKPLRQLLRNNMPKAEWRLWHELKNSKFHNVKFRRQYGIGPFIADFYCPAKRLVIELDGDSHLKEGAQEYDARRTEFIQEADIKVIRFTNYEIYEDLEGVLKKIEKEIQ